MTRPKAYPEVRAVLELIDAAGGPPLESLPPDAARRAAKEAVQAVSIAPEEVARVEDLRIPGPGGEIPIRVYTPAGDGPFPALIYFHGGGWVVCDIDTHDTVCRAIARRAEAVVVSVDYRLAPEHKFPAAVDDAYAATVWVAANAQRLSVDPDRIATGGDSAGGNLATVVALKCRDENGPKLALQVLVYPSTNLSSFDTPSHKEFADGYYLTHAEMVWFRDHYLRDIADGQNPHASPLLAPDLRGLPPALVITAECDPLCDEGEAYARRLADAGVSVSCTRYMGMIHPFFSLGGIVRAGDRAIEQVAAAVRSLPRP